MEFSSLTRSRAFAHTSPALRDPQFISILFPKQDFPNFDFLLRNGFPITWPSRCLKRLLGVTGLGLLPQP